MRLVQEMCLLIHKSTGDAIHVLKREAVVFEWAEERAVSFRSLGCALSYAPVAHEKTHPYAEYAYFSPSQTAKGELAKTESPCLQAANQKSPSTLWKEHWRTQ